MLDKNIINKSSDCKDPSSNILSKWQDFCALFLFNPLVNVKSTLNNIKYVYNVVQVCDVFSHSGAVEVGGTVLEQLETKEQGLFSRDIQ